MSTEEIQELLDLKGWSRTKLAAELDLSENTIHQWFSLRRNPGGPASILMRQWLEEAREAREEPNGAKEPQPA